MQRPRVIHNNNNISDGFGYILRLFLGFKFLTRNEEKNSFPREERGIFEEFLHLNLEYISPVQIEKKIKCIQKFYKLLSCDGFLVLHDA